MTEKKKNSQEIFKFYIYLELEKKNYLKVKARAKKQNWQKKQKKINRKSKII